MEKAKLMINNEGSYGEGVLHNFLSRLSPLPPNLKEIYLFGSRCRDDWRPDSDYDILIILEEKDREIISKLYDAVADILLDTGRMISLKIFTIAEFNRLKSFPTPFMHKILTEGKKLGSHG